MKQKSLRSVPLIVASHLVTICTTLTLTVLVALSANANVIGLADEVRRLVQLAEYIGVDYSEAVINGSIVNEEEFQEMVEFSAILATKSHDMKATHDAFQPVHQSALALQQAIDQKQDLNHIRTLCADIRLALLSLVPASSLPKGVLPIDQVTPLFTKNCGSCHGITGKGDGPLASQLTPAPTDFTDRERAWNRSVLGLYESISQGIDDTSMPAFNQLTEHQQWSLAFYVGSLAFQSTQPPSSTKHTHLSVADITLNTPAQLVTDTEGDERVIAWFRSNPELLMTTNISPLQFAKNKLEAARRAYERHDYSSAHDIAVTAYLDGFELVENSLDAKDSTLRRSIETNMMGLRELLKRPDQNGQLHLALDSILAQLNTAEKLLAEGNLSSSTLFSASLLILLREGLEALLIVIALAMVLIKADRRDALKFVHAGWAVALIAGVMTWVVAQSLFNISGASRETMEGVAALLAAGVLLYVGVWMHSKTQAAQWQTYITRNIHDRLKAGTLWGVTGLTFIAVYREVFETVLFYQALLTQAGASQHAVVVEGFVVGVGVLAVLAWLLTRFSMKLPISTFFSTTTYLLLALAFVLMGKGVSALQEAALISASPLPVTFEIDWIGVKSTWQGIMAQISVPAIFLMMYMISKNKRQQTID